MQQHSPVCHFKHKHDKYTLFTHKQLLVGCQTKSICKDLAKVNVSEFKNKTMLKIKIKFCQKFIFFQYLKYLLYAVYENSTQIKYKMMQDKQRGKANSRYQ